MSSRTKKPASPKILVFAGCGIGDLILATPLFASIHKSLPGARITVVLRYDLPREVLKGNPDVQKILHYPDKCSLYLFPRFPKVHKKVFKFLEYLIIELAFIFRIKSHRFDISMHLLPGGIADAHALITWLCGAKIRVGPQLLSRSGMSKWCYTHAISWDNYRHVVENNLDNLRALGFNDFDVHLKLFIHENDQRKADAILDGSGIRERESILGIHTGGGDGAKPFWPVERFVGVARHLIESRKCRVIVFFGPRELREITAFKDIPVIPIVNMPFGVVCGFINRCSLFISSDTGLGHAAAALMVPTLTLFGNGNERKHRHWGNKNFAINKLSDSRVTGVETAYLAGAEGKEALQKISVEEVIARADELLEECKGQRR
jgi:ADP-heptose:LPS heptosyltransferase